MKIELFCRKVIGQNRPAGIPKTLYRDGPPDSSECQTGRVRRVVPPTVLQYPQIPARSGVKLEISSAVFKVPDLNNEERYSNRTFCSVTPQFHTKFWLLPIGDCLAFGILPSNSSKFVPSPRHDFFSKNRPHGVKYEERTPIF